MSVIEEIEVIPRASHHKHVLCLSADTELCFVNVVIKKICKRMKNDGLALLSFAGPIVTIENSVTPTIQQRWDAIEETLASVSCYVKIRGHGRLAHDVPLKGENAWDWLRRFRDSFHDIRSKFIRMRENIVFLHLTLVFGVGLDTSVNVEFAERYELMFTYATGVIMEDLGIGNTRYWEKRFGERIKEYSSLHPAERFIPDAGSLSANELLNRVKKLFLLNLHRWDRTHGLDVPWTRSVLEVFAFEMEEASLVPFTKRGLPFGISSRHVERTERCARCVKLGL